MTRLLSALMFCLCTGAANASPDDRDRIPEGGETVSRHYATVESLQLHYRQAGSGKPSAARPVVALHQSPNSSQVYVEFLAVLGADRRVIAPDTPGFGGSDRPLQKPTIEDYAGFMEGFARKLNLPAVDVIGYHTGGAIAIEWARRHPDRIAHLKQVGVPAFTREEIARFSESPWPTPAPSARIAEAHVSVIARRAVRAKAWYPRSKAASTRRRRGCFLPHRES